MPKRQSQGAVGLLVNIELILTHTQCPHAADATSTEIFCNEHVAGIGVQRQRFARQNAPHINIVSLVVEPGDVQGAIRAVGEVDFTPVLYIG